MPYQAPDQGSRRDNPHGNLPALQAEISESFGAQTSGVQWVRNVALSLRPEQLSVISLVSNCEDWSSARLRQKFPFADRIFACNLHLEDLEDSENLTSIPGGFHDVDTGLLYINRQVSDVSFFQTTSSTECAAAYLKNTQHQGGILRTIASPLDRIVIQDTDCDSILTSLILGGFIPPDKLFLNASASVVHAGEPESIADLLQALRSERDLSFSVTNLKRLLLGVRLEERAEVLLVEHLNERRERSLRL